MDVETIPPPGVDFERLAVELAACLGLMKLAIQWDTPHNRGPARRTLIAKQLRSVADRLEPHIQHAAFKPQPEDCWGVGR